MDDLAHVLAIIELHNIKYTQRFDAQEKAILVSETNSEKWRANANEWRAAMNDREDKFASRSAFDLQIEAVRERLTKLELAQVAREGMGAGRAWGWALLLSLIGTSAVLVNLYLALSK